LILNSDLPMFAIDFDGMVLFWNSACENLFGYSKDDVIGKFIPIITEPSMYELETVVERTKQNKTTIFKTQKKSNNGEVLDLVITTCPIGLENNLIGLIAVVHNALLVKNITFIPYSLSPFVRESKRTFYELRNEIIISLSKGKMTINQLALDSGINWKTVEKHLTHLIGKKIVAEIFSSEYVRVFELTERGRGYAEEIKKDGLSRFIQKE
jgi:PAS domain S-box-containing protein